MNDTLKAGFVSLVEAIEKKYSVDEAEEELAIQIFVPKSAPGQKDTGEIVVPQELSLHNANIDCAGDKQKISSLCNNVTLLDISENKVSEWKEVFKLLDFIPNCSFLDLRKNPLCDRIDCLSDQISYPKLVKLVLNDLKLPWEVITQLLNTFPKLHELHLSLNQYSIIEIPANLTYPEMLYLHFNGNSISNWKEISKLGKAFPNLDTLTLLENPFQNISSTSIDEIIADFTNLKVVSLSKTKLASWDELEKFRYFPRLTHIRVKEIPFLEQYEEKERRQMILAYLPNIKNLNGGKVTENEVEDAERAFIRYHMDRDETHPARYHELESIYGKLDPLAEVNFGTAIQTVHVTLHYKDQSFLQELNLHLTLAELKKELEPLFEIPRAMMVCFHTSIRSHWGCDQMLYPDRSLARYKFESGDQIHVEIKKK